MITPSLHLCFLVKLPAHIYTCIPSTHKQQNNCITHKQRCRDGVINGFLSRSRHVLVPLLFHDVISLHLPSFQRNDFSTFSTGFSPTIAPHGNPKHTQPFYPTLPSTATVLKEECQKSGLKNVVSFSRMCHRWDQGS